MPNKTFGLIGKNLQHSFSKDYFSKFFIRENISNCLYENINITNLESFIEDIKNKKTKNPLLNNLCGFNVTMPYKEEIIKYLDTLDEASQKIKAVNVVRVERNKGYIVLKGYNSDCYGFEKSLKENLSSLSCNAIILGSGGAQKAVSFVLDKLHFPYLIVSREKREKGKIISYSELSLDVIRNHNLIINTTPLGMQSSIDRMPNINTDFLDERHIVFDLIYNPQKTLLLKEAEKRRSKIINGYDMLIYQAQKSWEIFNAK
ncbi:MAG: shikimate dehydrogenase [Bacteroidales bacterium]|jgi:shikimate dehydrogenase|nr:shikimate dehydrogenase [Bacteroidales bacterium]